MSTKEYDPVTDDNTLQYSENDMQARLKEQRQMCANNIMELAELSGSIIHTVEAINACLNATGEIEEMSDNFLSKMTRLPEVDDDN